jgi:hypothetical protein
MMIRRGIMVTMEVKPTIRFNELQIAAPVETPKREAPTKIPSPQPTRPEPFTPPDREQAPAPCPINPDHDVDRCSY